MELTETGVLIQIKIPERNNRVIRTGSRFVLEKPLLSSSRIIVYTDNLLALPLQANAVPELTVSDDINELIKRVQTIAEKMDRIAGNMTAITGEMADPQGDMKRILKNAEAVTSLLAEKESLLEMMMGSKESVNTAQEIIDTARDVAVRTDGVIQKIDTLTSRTDEQLYGSDGVFTNFRNILNDLMKKLEKVEITIDNLNRMSGNTADATENLTALRSDIDEAVMSIRILVEDLDSIIPFKDESEIKLP
jgi:phospholipid/cholesterol/gamma-HCH transport system substrate-binding protein